MRAVFVPISSEIRPNVPAVALCCCGDNYNVGEQKESERNAPQHTAKIKQQPQNKTFKPAVYMKGFGT